MSSQSWAEICSVRFGFVPAPCFTVQAPSLMMACHVPPPSPLTSYWLVAFVPAALSVRNREGIRSNVSFTVGIASSCVQPSKCKEIHSTSHGQHRAGDVPRALGAEKRDRAGDVLGLPLALHRHALDHPIIERAQLRVRRD